MPFNIGPGELLLLIIVALIIFGPKKLPEFGKALGESIGAFKKALSGDMTSDSPMQNTPKNEVATPKLPEIKNEPEQSEQNSLNTPQ